MKSIFIIGIALCVLLPLQAQTFKKADGYATEVSIDPAGNVFVQRTSNNLAKYDIKSKKFKPYQPGTSPSGLAVSRNSNSYRYKNPSVTSRLTGHDLKLALLKSKKYKDVTVTTNNSVWTIDRYGRLFLALTFGRNNKPNINALGSSNSHLEAVDKNKIFYIKNNNSIWHYDGNSNRKLPGAAIDIAYDVKQKKLYVIGVSKRLFVWNPYRKNWDLVSGTRRDFKQLSVHNGKIWAITTNNQIYTNDIKTITPYRYTNPGEYKLKITLEEISCTQAWDNDKKDDYLLNMESNLSINLRSYYLRNKKYGRIENQIKKYGKSNTLYVKRDKGQTDHAVVQLHTPERNTVRILNSGVFYIPKGIDLNKPIDFKIDIRVDEVSNTTKQIFNRIEKLNLKEILAYLDGDKKLDEYTQSRTENISYSNGSSQIRGLIKYYNMGNGYTALQLKTDRNNKPVIYGKVSGNKMKKDTWGTRKYTKPNVVYRIELID